MLIGASYTSRTHRGCPHSVVESHVLGFGCQLVKKLFPSRHVLTFEFQMIGESVQGIMSDTDEPNLGLGTMHAKATRGGDGVGGHLVLAGFKVDSHDLSMVVSLDLGPDALVEL